MELPGNVEAPLAMRLHTHTPVCIAKSPGPVHSQAGSNVLDRLHDGAHCSPHRLEQELNSVNQLKNIIMN